LLELIAFLSMERNCCRAAYPKLEGEEAEVCRKHTSWVAHIGKQVESELHSQCISHGRLN
jgi:hypothetical protein